MFAKNNCISEIWVKKSERYSWVWLNRRTAPQTKPWPSSPNHKKRNPERGRGGGRHDLREHNLIISAINLIYWHRHTYCTHKREHPLSSLYQWCNVFWLAFVYLQSRHNKEFSSGFINACSEDCLRCTNTDTSLSLMEGVIRHLVVCLEDTHAYLFVFWPSINFRLDRGDLITYTHFYW